MKKLILSIGCVFFLILYGNLKSYSQAPANWPQIITITVQAGTQNSSGTALYVFNNCWFKDYDASDFMLDLENNPKKWGGPKTRIIQSKSWNAILPVMNNHMDAIGYSFKDFKDFRDDKIHPLDIINIIYVKQ